MAGKPWVGDSRASGLGLPDTKALFTRTMEGLMSNKTTTTTVPSRITVGVRVLRVAKGTYLGNNHQSPEYKKSYYMMSEKGQLILGPSMKAVSELQREHDDRSPIISAGLATDDMVLSVYNSFGDIIPTE